MPSKMVYYSSHDSPYKSIGKQGNVRSPSVEDTLRSLRAEIRSCKEDNDRLVEAQEILARAQKKIS